jgi:hypothetical protein
MPWSSHSNNQPKPNKLNKVTLHDQFTTLTLMGSLEDDHRFLPAFSCGDEWYSVLPVLDLNIWEDQGEVKAALYLCHAGNTLTKQGAPLPVVDRRTRETDNQEMIGAFGHYPSKLKRYRELVEKLPADSILGRIIPSLLDDEGLTNLIDELESLESNVDAAGQIQNLVNKF